MKMIASTKLIKAQKAMGQAKDFGIANNELSQHTKPEEGAAKKNKLFVVISSDKGLCGGIHSSVSKATRRALKSDKIADNLDAFEVEGTSPVMVIGDKSKAQLSRHVPKNIVMSFNQIGRDIPTFADAAGVADLIVKSGVQYDSIVLVYNRFVSSLSYEPTYVEVRNESGLESSRKPCVVCLICVAHD